MSLDHTIREILHNGLREILREELAKALDAPAQLYSLPQVAERLSVSLRTAQQLVYDGEIAAIRVGRQVRVSAGDLADYIASRKSAVDTKEPIR